MKTAYLCLTFQKRVFRCMFSDAVIVTWLQCCVAVVLDFCVSNCVGTLFLAKVTLLDQVLMKFIFGYFKYATSKKEKTCFNQRSFRCDWWQCSSQRCYLPIQRKWALSLIFLSWSLPLLTLHQGGKLVLVIKLGSKVAEESPPPFSCHGQKTGKP